METYREPSTDASHIRKVDTEDRSGLPIRVLVPNDVPTSEGIPVSMPLDDLFGHLPVEFRKMLYNRLWERGLVEPSDYLKPEAGNLYKATIMSIIRVDFLQLRTIAEEMLHNGS